LRRTKSSPGKAQPQVHTIADVLFTQGFGTRRECVNLVHAGQVRVGGTLVDEPATAFATDGLTFEVSGEHWEYHASALVLLHKPAGYECSQKPSAWPSVLLLLPPPLRNRGVQSIGRLDQDTTGLLLLTDDGPLIHRLTAPKYKVPKTYEVITARPVEESELQRLRDGVLLNDDPNPVRAERCELVGPNALRLTLLQGKYHQVKRMLAAVGNHCVALHRSSFGAPQPGRWAHARPVALRAARRARVAIGTRLKLHRQRIIAGVGGDDRSGASWAVRPTAAFLPRGEVRHRRNTLQLVSIVTADRLGPFRETTS
jgi:16S rRNA pseudouridine516 synthase